MSNIGQPSADPSRFAAHPSDSDSHASEMTLRAGDFSRVQRAASVVDKPSLTRTEPEPIAGGVREIYGRMSSYFSSKASQVWRDFTFTPRVSRALVPSTVKHIDNSEEETRTIINTRGIYLLTDGSLNSTRLQQRIEGCLRRGRKEDFDAIESMIKVYSQGGGRGLSDIVKNEEALALIQNTLSTVADSLPKSSDGQNSERTPFVSTKCQEIQNLLQTKDVYGKVILSKENLGEVILSEENLNS